MKDKGQKHHRMPVSRDPFALVSVDRAVSELRRGRPIVILGSAGSAVLALSTEGATPEILKMIALASGSSPNLTMSGKRATLIGLTDQEASVATITSKKGFNANTIQALADPLSNDLISKKLNFSVALKDKFAFDCESASVSIAKIARLLPATVTAKILISNDQDVFKWCSRWDFLSVDAGDIFQYEKTAARSLRIVSRARTPIGGALEAEIIAFRPLDGGLEHLAIVIGKPNAKKSVLARIHSECFTGDLLGSLRCDCGDQLQGALAAIKSSGAGILLYLAQEGRGIGLTNKLRAYELQDRGFDTIDANEQLGFNADERIYLPSVSMLNLLEFTSINLMTNNPEKVSALRRFGIKVAKRVPLTFPSNEHNKLYLETKVIKSGHYF